MTRNKNRIYEAQERYVTKNRNSGKTRVNVWVPDCFGDELKAIAKRMREGKYEKVTD